MAFCWFYRRTISQCLDAAEPLADRTRRHVQSCPDCQTFYATQKRITQNLMDEAADWRSEPSPFLHGRIMASLERGGQAAEPRANSFRWVAASVVLGCLLLGSFIGLRLRHDGAPPDRAAPIIVNSSLFSAEQIPSGRELLEWSQTLEQPLQTELDSVVTDAKTAVRVLADNFLPEKLLAASATLSFER